MKRSFILNRFLMAVVQLATVAVAVTCLAAPGAGPAANKKSIVAASDLSLLQSGNLIYNGTKSSVCFADRFLSLVRSQTNPEGEREVLPGAARHRCAIRLPILCHVGKRRFHAEREGKDSTASLPDTRWVPARKPGLL